ncbi:MAG: hypothetical protein M3Q36_00580 [bacterium]|nr:hypothetical protein [bacterium]
MNRFKLSGQAVLMSGILLALGILALPSKTFAAVNGEWKDPVTITYNGVTYKDSKAFSNPLRLIAQINDNCKGTIDDFDGETVFDTSTSSLAQARIQLEGPGCETEIDDTINLSNTDRATALFDWVDAGQIQGTLSGNVYLRDTTETAPAFDNYEFQDEENTGCPDNVMVWNDSNNRDYNATYYDRQDDCGVEREVQFTLGQPDNKELAAGTGTPSDAIDLPTTGGTAETDNSCESNSGVLGWIMCPIGGLLDSITGWLDGQIQSMLIIKESYFTGEGGVALKGAWSQFRNIAYIILIPIMLVMVMGTALGFEVFSAYTVKRALPRLVIAVIFITLSWYICLFLINFFNVVGTGAKGLVTAPFQNVVQTTYDDVQVTGPQSSLKAALTAANIVRPVESQDDGDVAESFTSGASLGLLGAGGIAAGFITGAVSVGIIGTTLLSAAVVLGIVFLLLMVRQMLIIAFILMAPLAILAWIFPSNDKLWKLWWNSFSKLLMLFPLIMLLLGVGQVFALITGIARGDEDNRIVSAIIIILAYIAPYFFIPFAFKWAGGVFGALSGMANDRERGVLDRLKKGRTEKRAEGWQGFKSGTGQGLGQKNAFARNLGTRVGVGSKGRFGYGERGKQSLDQINRQAAVDQVMKGPNWNAVNQNDDALMAATYGSASQAMDGLMSQGVSEDGAKKAVAAVQSSIGFGRAQAVASAQQLVSTGTGYNGYNDKNGTKVSGLQQMTETLARASGGNTGTATSLAGFANSETKRTGRGDLAPGFGNLNRLVQKSVTGASPVTAGDYSGATREAWGSLPLSQLVGGKETQTRAFADYHLGMLKDGNRVQKREAAVALMEMQNSLPYANGANQRVINQTLLRAGVDTTGALGMSVEDQLAQVASIPNAKGDYAKDLEGEALTGGAIRGYARVYDERMGSSSTQNNIQNPPTP